jgi:HAD superfamily hydrolase (TIGR01509 family)
MAGRSRFAFSEPGDKTPLMIPCLLFDLDGTIVETDRLHFEAFTSVFTPHGAAFDWDTYVTRVMGKSNPAIAADFLPHVPAADHAGIMDAKEAAYRTLIRDLEAASGLLDLLAWADAQTVPAAVVTNAPRANADATLAALRLRDRFKVLVIGPELREAKPHPLPYLTALEALGGDPARSVAFEDSLSGVRSAAAAALGVVGLTTSLNAEALRNAGASVTGADFKDPAIVRFIRDRTGA